MSFHAVKCPMCFRRFSSDFIELHAQKCKGDSLPTASDDKSDKKRPQAKKMKISECGFASSSSSQKSKELMYNSSTHSNTSLKQEKGNIPLAERTRPSTFDEYVGQEKILGKDSLLSNLLKNGSIPSMILWGPPGCGKTSLAHVIATQTKTDTKCSTRFVKLSATNSGKADIQKTIDAAKNERRMFQRRTILFIDEIHRFNKLQQDTFLPHVEKGTIVLIGATTENPSFSLNSALLSRCRVIVLDKLSSDDVKNILVQAITKLQADIVVKWNDQNTHLVGGCSTTSGGSSASVPIDSNCVNTITEYALDFLSGMCDGDARTALNSLQMAIESVKQNAICSGKSSFEIDVDCIKRSLQRSHVLYDRAGDQHYEMISAFQKSIRGSDDNATLYWLARMLEGGEDPKFITRRMIRIASEDIGIADSNALTLAVSTQQACQFIGMPECNVVLAHCAVYLARAPKSAEIYMALRSAMERIQSHTGPLPGVPLHLRNASTKFMKDLGYGNGYQYKTSSDVKQTYLPESLLNCNFFDSS